MTLKTSRTWLLWLGIPIFLLCVLLYRILWDDTGLYASHELEQKIQRLEQDNQVQRQENEYLLRDITDLKTGTDLLEEKAREDLGLVKPGETFILFVEPDTDDTP